MAQNTLPYVHEFKAYTKERWVQSLLLDVLSTEFKRRSRVYFERAILSGSVKVNHKEVDLLYRLKDGDLITHLVHRHEPPIPTYDIETIYEDEEVLAVCKPSGMPCHPNSGYMKNTVTEIIRHEKSLKFISAVNRLDRQTSGIVLLAKTSQGAVKYHRCIAEREADKWYLCRVKGVFPEEVVDVSLPLHVSRDRCLTAVWMSGEEFQGKDSRTLFARVEVENGSSVLLCKPVTGRTHQIRVHLQALGFCIVNDQTYPHGYISPDSITYFQEKEGACIIVTPDKYKKYFSECLEGRELTKEYALSFSSSVSHTDLYRDNEEDLAKVATDDAFQFAMDTCTFCKMADVPASSLPPSFSVLDLHAFQYELNGMCFRTKEPEWASPSLLLGIDTHMKRINVDSNVGTLNSARDDTNPNSSVNTNPDVDSSVNTNPDVDSSVDTNTNIDSSVNTSGNINTTTSASSATAADITHFYST
ncbi:hypothetical protein NECID01_1572 [Nematocida sp. AWRm77]|nr:hypothetical protein NECID01_1572 [Nematocida sp. AWRm77]